MGNSSNKGSTETIRLGLLPPLTGVVGIYGEEIIRGAEMAVQEVNEAGGVLGKNLELIVEDDGSVPEKAVPAAEKLLDTHHCVALIGNLLSNSRIAVAYRVADPRKIPFLNFSFYEGGIISRYFFHFAALPNQQIDAMIPYMKEHYGGNMFFAGNNYEWPRGSVDAAKRALVKDGGKVLGEEYLPLGVTSDEIAELLERVEASGADVFVPYFAGLDQIELLTQFTQKGLKGKMAVVMGHYDENMASRLPPEVRSDFYSCNTYFMSVDTPENKQILERLAAMPGVDGIWPEGNGTLTNFSEGTYNCVKAFARAANQAQSVDPEALVEALATSRFSGPQGEIVMNPETHHAKVNSYLTRCGADGVFTIVRNFGSWDPVIPDRYRHMGTNLKVAQDEDLRIAARILEYMSEGVTMLNVETGTIIYANPGAEKIFGCEKGELIGRETASLYAPTSLSSQEIAQGINQILYKKGVWEGEIQYLNKNKKPFWCAVSISAFTHAEHGEVWMAVQKDISAQKLAEEKLEAINNKLEHRVEERTKELKIAQKSLVEKEKLAMLGQIAASVSHELRNPLGTIKNSISVMEELIPPTQPKMEDLLKRVDRNVTRCDRIISEMLDFTRSQKTNLEMLPLDTWLNTVLLEQTLPEGIQLHKELVVPDIKIWMDSEKLRRVVVNLLDNAVQALGQGNTGGPVKSTITVKTFCLEKNAGFSIHDSGPGIPDDIRPHIFEPLFSTKNFGVGLGMPIVKSIVEAHRGTINLETSPSLGTCFSVEIPLSPPAST